MDKPVAPNDRHRPGASADQPVRCCRVRLFCGEKPPAESENWYVPGHLTPEMNRPLDETDTPFERAVKDLQFQRQTLETMRLWQPLRQGRELTPAQRDLTHLLILMGFSHPISLDIVPSQNSDGILRGVSTANAVNNLCNSIA
jgi:hypothetical protein